MRYSRMSAAVLMGLTAAALSGSSEAMQIGFREKEEPKPEPKPEPVTTLRLRPNFSEGPSMSKKVVQVAPSPSHVGERERIRAWARAHGLTFRMVEKDPELRAQALGAM